MRHHILLFTLMVLLAVLPIAGCGANEEGGTSGETLQETGGTGGAQSDNEETPESKTEADTRVVTHAKGEIEVPANPEKIAVISDMGWEDNLLAMGAKPYIASTFSWSDTGFYPHVSDRLEDAHGVDSYAPNMEKLLELDPDLIIINGQVEKFYDQLNKIAPTVLLEYHPDWRVTHLKLGEILGKTEEAQNVLDEYDQKVEEIKSEIDPVIGGEKVMFALINEKQIRIQGTSGHAINDLFYKDLGLTPAEGIPTEEQRTEVSLEGLTTFKADHIFIQKNRFGNVEDFASQLFSSTVWKNLDAVKNGNVYEIRGNDNWLAMAQGPLGREMILEQIRSFLVQP